jgi:hypothetical protein
MSYGNPIMRCSAYLPGQVEVRFNSTRPRRRKDSAPRLWCAAALGLLCAEMSEPVSTQLVKDDVGGMVRQHGSQRWSWAEPGPAKVSRAGRFVGHMPLPKLAAASCWS